MCRVLTAEPAGLSVLKFGSSLLSGPAGFRSSADAIVPELAAGRRVVAVVSAVKGTTDALLAGARALSARPAASLLTLLLRTGEDASAALLGIELVERSVNAHVLSADELGLRTRGPFDDADPVGVNVDRLRAALDVHDVVVIPGFVGRDESGHPSLLGRGGSDLTALVVGAELGAERIRLVKDVPGVFPLDPRSGVRTSPLVRASCAEVARVGNGVVQEKALRFAARAGIAFRVGGLTGEGTEVIG